jgi:uncharacterized membrane protein
MSETPDATGESGESGAARMPTGRLEAFSDGVFAIAITLLVLDLVVPVTRSSTQHLLQAIGHEWPGYLGYVVSFSTIGALWVGHDAITACLGHANSTLMRLNLLLLFVVALLPFPTRLMASFVDHGDAERVASTVYGLTLLAAAVLLSVLWRYALSARLVRPDIRDEDITLLTARLTPGIAGYAALIVIGLFVPVLAVIGYFVVALYLLLPFRVHFGKRRRS